MVNGKCSRKFISLEEKYRKANGVKENHLYCHSLEIDAQRMNSKSRWKVLCRTLPIASLSTPESLISWPSQDFLQWNPAFQTEGLPFLYDLKRSWLKWEVHCSSTMHCWSWWNVAQGDGILIVSKAFVRGYLRSHFRETSVISSFEAGPVKEDGDFIPG